MEEVQVQPGEEIRTMFEAVVSFESIQTGIVSVYAKGKDHAKEILSKQFKDSKNFEVIDIYPMPVVNQEDVLNG